VVGRGGGRAPPRDVDLTLAGLVITRNGELEVTGLGAAVQGSPYAAVAWLANTLGRLDIPFLAGEVILSGAQAPLVPVSAGDTLVCHIAGVGSCTTHFKEASVS
jgi:2-oxopent-4-enoate/cis-2-oxohex-4-enoate hydratase